MHKRAIMILCSLTKKKVLYCALCRVILSTTKSEGS
nr:MAG TPA: hypothetical protein [Caudoviricetes sp.]